MSLADPFFTNRPQPPAAFADAEPIEFQRIWATMHAREALADAADEQARAFLEAERAAERDAESRAFQAVVDRRVDFEIEFAAEVRTLTAERGGTFETTHDIARATANLATRWGREYDRAEVAEVLARGPEPVYAD
jgi:hypothetical protein